MRKSLVLLLAILILGGVAVGASAFIVRESDQVVIVQFGEVIRLVDQPGMHFKIPIIQEAKRFEKRWLEWDGDANQITTLDKRYIYIDVFARWRISEPLLFIETLRDEISAQGRLDDILDNATRNTVANRRLIEVVRSTDRPFATDLDESVSLGGTMSDDIAPPDGATAPESAPDTPEGEDAEPAEPETVAPAPETASPESKRWAGDAPGGRNPYAIEIGRDQLTRQVLEKAASKASELGIEIKDVQIKRVNYIESVESKVFDRMISERKRVAEAYRSEGRGRAAEIEGQMEMEMQQIQSEAYRRSQVIMGTADAKAAEIYAEAYNRNPEFYRFVKTLESYRETMDEDNWLILSTDADYVRLLQTMKGSGPE